MDRRSIIGAIAAASFLASAAGWAHSGKLDGYGCHHDHQTGGYHCHKGKNAGRQFKTQKEAIARPKATEPVKKKKTAKTES